MLLRAKLLINTLNRWGSKSEEWRLRLPFNDIILTHTEKEEAAKEQTEESIETEIETWTETVQ